MSKLFRNETMKEDPLYEYHHYPFEQYKYSRSDNKYNYKKHFFRNKTETSNKEAKMIKRMSDEFQIVSNLQPLAESINAEAKPLIKVENDWQRYEDIPTLENNLDIVTKYHGVFPMEELTKVNPSLQKFFSNMPQYTEINEDIIAPYYSPGKDENLRRLTRKYGCEYLMSTSTVSSVLSHIYYAISNHKSPHFSGLSQAFDNEPLKFMVSQRKPNTVFLTQIDKKLFSLDGDDGFEAKQNIVLMKMGKYMEKMMTTEADEFMRYYVLDS